MAPGPGSFLSVVRSGERPRWQHPPPGPRGAGARGHPGTPDRRPLGAWPNCRPCAECSPPKFIDGLAQTVMGRGGVPARFSRRSAPPSGRSGRDGKMPLRRDPPRAAPAPPTASCYVQRRCARAAQAMMRRRRKSWCRRRTGDMPATAIRQCPRLRSRGKERDARPQRALARRRRQRRRLRAPPFIPEGAGGARRPPTRARISLMRKRRFNQCGMLIMIYALHAHRFRA